jgi:hypothetical protein
VVAEEVAKEDEKTVVRAAAHETGKAEVARDTGAHVERAEVERSDVGRAGVGSGRAEAERAEAERVEAERAVEEVMSELRWKGRTLHSDPS